MIEFGNTLRAAREAKGMTITQLADATHMTANTIRELESEDFSRLPAPIYGRGFVKLFCEAVGLDPKPLLEEFMAILDGERDASIRERPISAAPAEPESQLADEELEEPAPQERPAPVPEEVLSPQDNEPQTEENDVPATESAPPVISQQDLFMKPPQPQAQDFTREPPLQQPVFSAPPVQQPATEATIPPPPQRQISRYAAPVGQTRAIPSPAYWRIALLGGGALAVCLVALLAVHALFFVRYFIISQFTFVLPTVFFAYLLVARVRLGRTRAVALMALQLLVPLFAWQVLSSLPVPAWRPRHKYRDEAKYFALPWKAGDDSADRLAAELDEPWDGYPGCGGKAGAK